MHTPIEGTLLYWVKTWW